jgi:hypothetical protein
MLGVVEPINVVTRFGEQMRMPALTAGHVEYSRSNRQSKHIDDARGFMAIALGRENRLILEQILGIEIRFPPLAFTQKKTGSR